MKMVNTFITNSDLTIAVANINSQRLGKQRVEAFQILNLLVDAKVIADAYSYEKCPTSSEIKDQIELDIEREKWFKSVFCRYKKEPSRLVYRKVNKNWKRVSLSDLPLYNDKNLYRQVTGGFHCHPMVLMWIGHINGLRYYINVCIDEWISRGYTNNMEKYELVEPIVLPWWVNCMPLINSHICALLRKEKKRGEPVWYWKRFASLATTEWYQNGYLWICHLNYEQRTRLFLGEEMPASEICDEITDSS